MSSLNPIIAARGLPNNSSSNNNSNDNDSSDAAELSSFTKFVHDAIQQANSRCHRHCHKQGATTDNNKNSSTSVEEEHQRDDNGDDIPRTDASSPHIVTQDDHDAGDSGDNIKKTSSIRTPSSSPPPPPPPSDTEADAAQLREDILADVAVLIEGLVVPRVEALAAAAARREMARLLMMMGLEEEGEDMDMDMDMGAVQERLLAARGRRMTVVALRRLLERLELEGSCGEEEEEEDEEKEEEEEEEWEDLGKGE
ncbi:hypothetical protein F5X96DRAFT_689279 [Biscogniauxia mediterranea]|nr:hypothetical protein F5X96DRAFT_689279 [Biscogniauxia mediterranea]